MSRAIFVVSAVVGYVAVSRWLDYRLTIRALHAYDREAFGPLPKTL